MEDYLDEAVAVELALALRPYPYMGCPQVVVWLMDGHRPLVMDREDHRRCFAGCPGLDAELPF